MEGMGAKIGMAVLGSIAGSLVSNALTKKPEQQQAQPLLIEQPPAAATKDTAKKASDEAGIQARKRMAGATGRSDTIRTSGPGDQASKLYGAGGGTGGDQPKTLLGF